MTREQAAMWHSALASSAGMLSGALARGYKSKRLLQDVISMIKPALKEMEAVEKIMEHPKPKRERVRV